VVKKN